MQAHNKPVTKKNTKQLTQQRNKARHSNHQKKKGGGGVGGEKVGEKNLWFCPFIKKTSFLGAEAAKNALMLSLVLLRMSSPTANISTAVRMLNEFC